MRDIWTFPAIAPWEKLCGKHPTQKPLKLLVRLLLMASNENSIICDPFSGSSSTGIAANILKRKFIGFEKESEFIKISIARKQELDKNFDAFYRKIDDLKINFKQKNLF